MPGHESQGLESLPQHIYRQHNPLNRVQSMEINFIRSSTRIVGSKDEICGLLVIRVRLSVVNLPLLAQLYKSSNE